MLLPSSLGQELRAEEEGSTTPRSTQTDQRGRPDRWAGGRPAAGGRSGAAALASTAAAVRRGRRRRRKIAHGASCYGSVALQGTRQPVLEALCRRVGAASGSAHSSGPAQPSSSESPREAPATRHSEARPSEATAMPSQSTRPPPARRSAVASHSVDRQCSRPACAEPAAATLTYVYARGTAWLDGLSADRDPHSYDLCERHASRVGVPVGWRLEDRRGSLVMTGLVVAGAEVPSSPGAAARARAGGPGDRASLADSPVTGPARASDARCPHAAA